MAKAQSSGLTVHLSLSGRPLARRTVRFEGVDAIFDTDERGHLDLELPLGPLKGSIDYLDEALPFELVNAVGLRLIRVDLRAAERPLDDKTTLATMPSERYVPLSRLGSGSAGLVFKCRDTSLDRLVAIKILHEDFAGLPENNTQFVTEARRLAQVHSPHLIDIYDVGVHNERAYIVFEYIDGPNLEQLRVAEQKLVPATVAAAGLQLAQALLAIHEAGLLHRDVKPSNGLVDRRGVVKLADFGLAGSMLDLANPLSRVFGTPPFMSPEQLQGKPLGPSADVYSLGASLYDLATGHPPFYEGDLLLAALFDAPADLRTARPDCPERLATLIHQMLAKAPAERPDSTDVIDGLMSLAADASSSSDQPYLPRLSGQALGVRWLAGPATRRVERFRSDELDDAIDPAAAEHPDTEVDERPGRDAVDDTDTAGEWGDAETRLMARPQSQTFDGSLAATPDVGPTAGSREYSVTLDRVTVNAHARRMRWLSFGVGLILGLGVTAALLSMLT